MHEARYSVTLTPQQVFYTWTAIFSTTWGNNLYNNTHRNSLQNAVIMLRTLSGSVYPVMKLP